MVRLRRRSGAKLWENALFVRGSIVVGSVVSFQRAEASPRRRRDRTRVLYRSGVLFRSSAVRGVQLAHPPRSEEAAADVGFSTSLVSSRRHGRRTRRDHAGRRRRRWAARRRSAKLRVQRHLVLRNNRGDRSLSERRSVAFLGRSRRRFRPRQTSPQEQREKRQIRYRAAECLSAIYGPNPPRSGSPRSERIVRALQQVLQDTTGQRPRCVSLPENL